MRVCVCFESALMPFHCAFPLSPHSSRVKWFVRLASVYISYDCSMFTKCGRERDREINGRKWLCANWISLGTAFTGRTFAGSTLTGWLDGWKSNFNWKITNYFTGWMCSFAQLARKRMSTGTRFHSSTQFSQLDKQKPPLESAPDSRVHLLNVKNFNWFLFVWWKVHDIIIIIIVPSIILHAQSGSQSSEREWMNQSCSC